MQSDINIELGGPVGGGKLPIYNRRPIRVGGLRPATSLSQRARRFEPDPVMLDIAQTQPARAALPKRGQIAHRIDTSLMLPRFKNTTAQLVLLAFDQWLPS